MWAKLAQLLIANLLKPLVEKSVVALIDWCKNWLRKRKQKKDTDKKVENYENSDDADSANDSFNKLP